MLRCFWLLTTFFLLKNKKSIPKESSDILWNMLSWKKKKTQVYLVKISSEETRFLMYYITNFFNICWTLFIILHIYHIYIPSMFGEKKKKKKKHLGKYTLFTAINSFVPISPFRLMTVSLPSDWWQWMSTFGLVTMWMNVFLTHDHISPQTDDNECPIRLMTINVSPQTVQCLPTDSNDSECLTSDWWKWVSPFWLMTMNSSPQTDTMSSLKLLTMNVST